MTYTGRAKTSSHSASPVTYVYTRATHDDLLVPALKSLQRDMIVPTLPTCRSRLNEMLFPMHKLSDVEFRDA
ncbi:hypothetical protein ACPXAU_24380, partial [Salmonella enterica]|uniref:hypothetical protein n=1 Tax=Salmonella enterica TaxID=28901 RepID=UPI003CF6FADD